MGWGGKWEQGSGWGTHVHPWLIHVNVWKKPPQYCKAISLPKNKERKKEQPCEFPGLAGQTALSKRNVT